jgi:MSHA biogenesis protein MshL
VSVVTSKILSVTVGTTGPGGTTSLPLAYSEVRESDSVVTAKSGQLIVIGGLMQKSHSNQDYRVPLLGDIPLIGNLFKSQQRITDHTELVILLRPIIVDGDSQWSQIAGEEVDRAAALDPKVRSSAQ